EPDGTFYAFVSMRNLPARLADGMAFFRAALDCRVITVPGVFFDVNPGHRRAQRLSRFHQHVRLPFGPGYREAERGLDRLDAMIGAKAGGRRGPRPHQPLPVSACMRQLVRRRECRSLVPATLAIALTAATVAWAAEAPAPASAPPPSPPPKPAGFNGLEDLP